jgi:hypothetical protein
MLTIDRPITLTAGADAPVLSAAFGERIRANYTIMTAEFSPEELLFLLVNPPEIPFQEGDFVHIAMGDVSRNTQNIIFDIVNNIVNRVLLEDGDAPTYQDTVYIDMALRKLGIENVALFMEQARAFREENLNVYRLTSLYRDNLQILRDSLSLYAGENRASAPERPETEGGARGRDTALELHSEIFRRLDTTQIIRTLARFAQSAPETHTRVDAREMWISEQQRAAEMIELNEYRHSLPVFVGGDIYYNANHYETGDILETPTDEKSVLRQATAASLLQVIANVLVSRADNYLHRRESWLDVTGALHRSAWDSVQRFTLFHERSEAVSKRRESVDLKTFAQLTHREAVLISRYLERIHIADGRRIPPPPASAGEDTDGSPQSEKTEVGRNMRRTARKVINRLSRIYSMQLYASEMSAQRFREYFTETETAPARVSEYTLTRERDRTELRTESLTHRTRETETETPAEQARDAALPPQTHDAEGSAPARSAFPESEAAATILSRMTATSQSASAPEKEGTTHTEIERDLRTETREIELRAENDAAGLTDEARAGNAAADAAENERLLRGTLQRIAGETAERLNELQTERAEIERDLRTETREIELRAENDDRFMREEQAGGAPPAMSENEKTLRESLQRIDRETAEIFKTLQTDREETKRELRAETRETIVHRESAAPLAEESHDGSAPPPGAAEGEKILRETLQRIAREPAERPGESRTERAEIERELRAETREIELRAENAAAGISEEARAGRAAADAAEGERILRETLQRIDRENRERLERLKESQTREREKNAAPPRPDRKRIMRDALRAIDDPVLVLSEAMAQDTAEAPSLFDTREDLFIHADAASKRILESLRLLKEDPAAAAAAGITLADGPAALMADVAAVERARAESARPADSAADILSHTALRGPAATAQGPPGSGAVGAGPAAPHPAEDETAWATAPPIVHRQTAAPPDLEEILQRREKRVVEERARREETTETTARTSETWTQNNRTAQDIAAKSADDITDMINTTLMRQIGTIADRVYGQLEKKLQNEKARRGRI